MRLATLLTLICTSGACACTIPVFRYALDRWEADKFHLLIPKDVAQDTSVQDLLRPLRANGKANLDITTSSDAALKAAELRSSRNSDQLVWSGALDKTSLGSLLESPVRQKIVEHILAGDSVVWVVADNGSPLDTAAADHVEKRLKFLEQVAALPVQDPNDPDSQLGPGPPLKLKFTVMRIRRDDPAEKPLLRMLTGPGGEIDPDKTSFAAAVFGRGRVLGAWPLEILDDASLEDVSMFLVGRCGCRMKNENPGWDILLNVDWEKSLGEASLAVHSTAGSISGVDAAAPQAVSAEPEVVTISGESAERKDVAVTDTVSVMGVLAGSALLLLALRSLWRK
ncbi:hypothetical protein [Prosthecobacter sp.]|uniref:hypothetical protein n=1 Tax=Prosthecobacter sp. TaxID=1965333 RepID=UPI001DD9C986|nr:hypothetical protein [Prosthecobacter sp.]MCB1274948.1 hypothetical protein [Prosthecobacter sp.]